MKNFIGSMIIAIVLMLAAPAPAEAQLTLVKDSKGYYIPKTVKEIGYPWTGLYGADTNWTSSYVTIPPTVDAIICYLEIDSAGTTDTLTVAIYGSNQASTTEGSLITTFTVSAAAGNERKEVAIPDPYVYFTGTYSSGSTFPKHKRGRLVIAPRQ